MRFEALCIPGAMLLVDEPSVDDRGSFRRAFCEQEFRDAGLPTRFPQMSFSVNHRKGTVRGMHFQIPPHEEAKVVRCTRGAIYDVIIDLRPGSSTFKKSLAIELTQENQVSLYVPPGFAHGFQTLADDSEVFYMIDQMFVPGYARGVRWNDPTFGVSWPLDAHTISERDANYPNYTE